MQDNNEFYIGWQKTAPTSYQKKMKAFILGLCFIVPTIAVLLVYSQMPVAVSTFEFGKLSQLEGILETQPIPCLKMPIGKTSDGKDRYQRVLLVGFGKIGAAPTLQAIAQAQGTDLNGKSLKLEGSLIYYDGLPALELTNGTKAFVGFSDLPTPNSTVQVLDNSTLRGEILDPKCYLGVMKPGEGKPHRSCAIRCISGGIPPFFKTINSQDERQYYFLLDANGKPIHQQVAQYVADEVQLCGSIEQWDNWYILKVDLQQGIQKIKPYWAKGQDLAMCWGE